MTTELDAADRELLAAVAACPAEADLDGWTVTDLVTHIAAWLEEGVRRLDALSAGGPPRTERYDVDAFNAAAVAESRANGTTPTQALERYRVGFASFCTAVAGAGGASREGSAWLTLTVEHLREHAGRLRAEAPRRLPAQPYSYGSRDVQPGYESQGWSRGDQRWGRDPWGDEL